MAANTTVSNGSSTAGSDERAIARARAFSARARELAGEAKRLADLCPDSDLDEWLAIAKARGMTWVEALEWTNARLARNVQ